MTISSDQSAPLFAVVGATGLQGRSIVDAIASAATPYRVRALARQPAKAIHLRDLGAEVVPADMNDPQSLERAFHGASIVFAMTLSDYSAGDAMEKEIQQGHNLVDAAYDAGVGTFVFSGQLDIGKLSGNRFPVPAFTAKAEIVEYARSKAGPMKVKAIYPGSFTTNYFAGNVPRKNAQGDYVLSLPVPAETRIPIIDVAHDLGQYVLAATREDAPDSILAGTRYMTMTEIAQTFAKFFGKPCRYQEKPVKEYYDSLAPFTGPVLASGVTAMWQGFAATGYYGGADLAPSNRLINRSTRTLLESLVANRDIAIKAFQ